MAECVSYCDNCERVVSWGYFSETIVYSVFDSFVLDYVERRAGVSGNEEASLLYSGWFSCVWLGESYVG